MRSTPLVSDGPISLYVDGKVVGTWTQHNLTVIDHSASPSHQGAKETRGTLGGFSPVAASRFSLDSLGESAAVRLAFKRSNAIYAIDGSLILGSQFLGGEPHLSQ